MMEKLYIIILNWNGYNYTKDCLISLKNEVGIDYTIILVDNHSEQNEYELLKSYCQSHYLMCVCYDEQQARNGGEVDTERKLLSIDSQDKIVLIRNSDNLGFAAGNNVALDYVEKLGYKYVLLLNNDTEIAENAISKLFSFALEHSQFTAFVPQIRLFDPSNRIWNCGGKITWYGARFYYYSNEQYMNVPQTGYKEIDYATGCALLFDMNRTGKLTERFFFGEEDFEFSLRLKKKSLKKVCLYSSVIYHKVSLSQNKISNNNIGKACYHYAIRLADLKEYQNKLLWIVSVCIYSVFSVFTLKCNYGASLMQCFTIQREIFRLLKKNDFSKYIFLQTLKLCK